MDNFDEGLIEDETQRRARPPALGPRTVASGSAAAYNVQTAVDWMLSADGSIKRRWSPGDPWSSDYYFG